MEWVDSSLKKRRWTNRNVGGSGEVSLSGLLTKGAVVCTGSQEACATSVFARCCRQEFYFNNFHVRLFKSATIRVQLTPSYTAAK